jgi:hypothetical protein
VLKENLSEVGIFEEVVYDVTIVGCVLDVKNEFVDFFRFSFNLILLVKLL